ncbi:hypothetical protein [Methylobacterium sp. BTF04]|uniref:hypothetical protein n=1 Tax=Methylobacterium sp. BTF04 TaxID=2708300 RepID=UPI0019537E57|nr:hypothetical protein [Methylobacterium sp. BTF04]
MIEMNLEFEHILNRALSEWPDPIDLSVLVCPTAKLERYSIYGLSMEWEETFIGKDEEVIITTLQDAIYSVVHYAAKAVTVLEKKHIRSIAVQIVFEDMLKDYASRTHLNWRNSDRELVREYFSVNTR